MDHYDTKPDSVCGAMRFATPWLSDEDRAEVNAVWARGQVTIPNPPSPAFPLVGRVAPIARHLQTVYSFGRGR
jgi:hypothetical protein